MNMINLLYEPGDRAGTPAGIDAQRTTMRVGSSAIFTLRKSGSRPISFSGRHLGHANGYRVGTPLWHELNLYQTDDGRYVADIRVFTKAQGSNDQFHVHVAENLEEAISFFEGYDPRIDVPADFDLDDNTLAPAELVVHAATLKYRIAETVSQYKAVLSAFLKDLNNG